MRVFIISMYICFGVAIIGNAIQIAADKKQSAIDDLEGTGYVQVDQSLHAATFITITVPEDLRDQRAEWIARLCLRITTEDKIIVRSPIGLKFTPSERRMLKALGGEK